MITLITIKLRKIKRKKMHFADDNMDDITNDACAKFTINRYCSC